MQKLGNCIFCAFAAKIWQTILSSNLRPTTRECVHLVTRGNFRSRDKNVSHTNQSAIAENSTIHTDFMALYYIEPELWAIEVSGCSYDIDLDLMTFIYAVDKYSLVIMNRVCKYKLPMSRLSKVIV